MSKVDIITATDIEEMSHEKRIIQEELDLAKDRMAQNVKKIDLNKPAVLTKEELKGLKKIKRQQRWTKIKNIFKGKDTEEWYPD